ncbi:MAG: hypothetical protein EOO03_03150 [Chitinophagaceae bacterium]|nr:MAG: hypothetical protein EOO03_03150 [Chitinophagaceae bacterium]
MCYKKNLIKNLIHGSYNLSAAQYMVLEKVRNAIDFAWNDWEVELLASHYDGEKPERPTHSFIALWVELEDFSASGYNESHLQELFC